MVASATRVSSAVGVWAAIGRSSAKVVSTPSSRSWRPDNPKQEVSIVMANTKDGRTRRETRMQAWHPPIDGKLPVSGPRVTENCFSIAVMCLWCSTGGRSKQTSLRDFSEDFHREMAPGQRGGPSGPRSRSDRCCCARIQVHCLSASIRLRMNHHRVWRPPGISKTVTECAGKRYAKGTC
jgi:hypothetical protein